LLAVLLLTVLPHRRIAYDGVAPVYIGSSIKYRAGLVLIVAVLRPYGNTHVYTGSGLEEEGVYY
jgi:hypothetical protein